MVSWMDVNVRKTKAPDDFRNSSTLRKLVFSTNTKAQNLFTRKNLFASRGSSDTDHEDEEALALGIMFFGFQIDEF